MKPAVMSGVIVLALAGAFGYYGIHQPAQQKRQELQQQLNLERETKLLKESIVHGIEDIDALRKRLPAKPETEWLLQTVGELARSQNIQLASIAPDEPKRVQDAVRLGVTLRFVTSYHQLGQFLSALENSPDYLWIETMDVTRDPASGGAQVSLTVSSIWVPPFAIPR